MPTEQAAPFYPTAETKALVVATFGKGAVAKTFERRSGGFRFGIKKGKEWVVGTYQLASFETPDGAARAACRVHSKKRVA